MPHRLIAVNDHGFDRNFASLLAMRISGLGFKFIDDFENDLLFDLVCGICGASSEFVSSSIPSRQILNAHAQPFRRARDLAFCLKVPLDSLLV